PFNEFALVMYHSVTTELEDVAENVREMVNAILENEGKYVVIYPNNDSGSEFIFKEYYRLKGRKNIRVFPSLRFEYFLSLLKSADFILGNSSAGIHEAPVFGVPTVNIGSRQTGRFSYCSIFNVGNNKREILIAMKKAMENHKFTPSEFFGVGNSAEQFLNELKKESLWATPKQKTFQNLPV
ncbi:UDP-N-acetylglucosamine 2-epimerase, partial [bacterium]|nr:UDP-N-acetylglucosamine 2-epimerase [bacterium]